MNLGDEIAQKALAKKLRETFPHVEDVDFDVLAADVVSDITIDACRMVDEREQAMQQALKATMDYMSGVSASQRQHIEALHARITELNKGKAALISTKPSGRAVLEARAPDA